MSSHYEGYEGHESHGHRYDEHQPPSKRYKRDEDADPTNPNPSVVIHVRNLSAKATEADLLEALSNFGPIAYATCMHNSRMALVEFESIEGARACVTFAATNQIFVAGTPALFNYSTSQCIQRLGFESEHPNKVLVLTVYNVLYPINVDVIYEICAPHGNVKRIALVRKALLQALVEYESADIAKAAKHAMNGADIYSGCCTLKVEFAKPESVRVTRNDGDQRDYTMPAGEFHEPLPSNRKTLLQSEPPAEYGYPTSDRGAYRGRGGGAKGRAPGAFGDPASAYGYGYDSYAAGADPYAGYGDEYGYKAAYDAAAMYGGYGGGGQGCVLMIYGIDQNKLNCDMIFNLLCLYGNVLRVKFMRSKMDTAMAEMGQPDEVTNILGHLQGATLFELQLEFKPSKQDGLHGTSEPFELPDGSPSFRDYSASRNQRFATQESAARNRIVYPTTVLHWYNAPGNMDEERLMELFSERKAPKPVSVFVFPSRTERSSSGTVEFETVEKANEALVLANHTPVLSPLGKTPYIVKMAYATPRRNFAEPGDTKEGIIESAAAGSGEPRGGYRGRGRGRGGFRGSSEGGYRGSSEGFRGGYRGRGEYRGRGRGFAA